MRILVTGCAGFIGSHLSEQLLAQGHDVLGVDVLTDYYSLEQKQQNLEFLLGHPGFTFHEVDLACVELEPLIAGRELVFHQAAQPGVRASWGRSFETYLRQNVLVTQRLLEAVKGQRLHKFVYASSSSIYGDAEAFPTHEAMVPRPVSPYGVSKLAGEQLAYLYWSNYKVPTIALRYFTVYGPRQRPDMAFHRFIRWALDDQPLVVYGDGEQTRDFTFVSDAVAANLSAGFGDAQGVALNIGGGSRVSVNQVIAALQDLLGRELRVDYRPSEHGDVRHTSADITLAAQMLGYQPAVGLRDGLAAELSWAEPNLSLDAYQSRRQPAGLVV
jgi:nucleoside-diphosphate-sugar epimerase